MDAVSDRTPALSPLVVAATLLVARSLLVRLGLPGPTAAQVLEATGASRSRVYELATTIPAALAALARPPGRPRATRDAERADGAELSAAVRDYVMDHPGCVTGRGRRRSYSDGFRRFVLDLARKRDEVDLDTFASAVGVPLPTLRDWLRAAPPAAEAEQREPAAHDEVRSARMETVVHQWSLWEGGFVSFCDHLRDHLRLPWGRTLVASILEQLGARLPRRRPGRAGDDRTLSGAFETFFPGAQWEGDGSPIVVRVGDARFGFNLELVTDADSGAVVGLSVRDAEDEEAVVEAFEAGVETTGEPPLSLELDNRPSNHGSEVAEALGQTIRLRSTPGRPQSNPHAEGAFGLFQQVAPSLALDTKGGGREVARQVLELVAVTWARSMNHRPRTDRGGRSRVELYRETEPTAEEVEKARVALAERARRQERALETRRRRQDPTVRAVLDRALGRLGLDGSDEAVRSAMACYPLDAVLAGIAIFGGKQKTATLPPGVDARYLLGIIRNVSNKDEGQLITEELIRLRLEARDIMLEHLAKERDQLLSAVADHDGRLRAMLDRAMASERQLDRLFWLESVADSIAARPQTEHAELLRAASQRIHATFAVPYGDRLAAVRMLARKVIPLE